MQVTDVRVRRVEKDGKMKAIVSITLDNEFVIHDIKVIEGEKGLFIAMPSRKAADGEYRDIAHPINSGTRDMIQSIILNKYETTLLENESIKIHNRKNGSRQTAGRAAALLLFFAWKTPRRREINYKLIATFGGIK